MVSVRLSGGVLNRRGSRGSRRACEQLVWLPASRTQSTPDAARVLCTSGHARGVCSEIHSDLGAHAAYAMTSAQCTNARSIAPRCAGVRWRLFTAPRFCVHQHTRIRLMHGYHTEANFRAGISRQHHVSACTNTHAFASCTNAHAFASCTNTRIRFMHQRTRIRFMHG